MRVRTARDIGLVIRERRRSLDLDQKTLAERAGVSRQWIVEAEKGKRRAELWLVLRTLRALGLGITIEEPSRPLPTATLPASSVSLDRIIDAHRKPRRTAR